MSKISNLFFKYRSYTPIPFLIIMLVFQEADWISIVIGLVIAIIGESFRLWGVCYAGSETRTTGSVGGTYLIVSGAFSYLRNPLYFGNILMYLGIGVMSMALFPYLQIIALIFFFIQYHFIINEEEQYLQKTFGEEYSDYKKNVPRLFPKFSPYKNKRIQQPPLNIKAGLRSERRTLQAFGIVTLILICLKIFSIGL